MTFSLPCSQQPSCLRVPIPLLDQPLQLSSDAKLGPAKGMLLFCFIDRRLACDTEGVLWRVN